MKNKIIISVITLMLVVMPFISSKQEAKAQFGGPVFETNPMLIAAAVNTSGQTTSLTMQQFTEYAFKVATEALKRRILNLVVDQIIGWIQGEGKPKFITDWKQFVDDAANAAVGDVAYALGLGFLCSPFDAQVQLLISGGAPRFGTAVACTLDQIVSNIENFYDDFRAGGFIAYAYSWQPQNNFYGSVLMAMQELDRKKTAEKDASILEALSGGGFLGTKSCSVSNGRIYCHITTPGAQIGALAAKAIGSDIDYLVNAQDIAVYVGAIADALINRLIKEGIKGLQGVDTPNAPAAGYIRETGPCAGLSGQALSNCLAIQKAQKGDFQQSQKAYLNRIDATLLPRQSGEQSLIKSADSQKELVARLTELRDCQAARNLPEMISTDADLQNEQTTLNRLNEEIIANRWIIDPLINAKTNIANPPTKDTVTISFYFNDVIGLLDDETAKTFQEAKDAQTNEIQEKVEQKLPMIQSQLSACRR